ncbi:MAG: CDP-diacylglycerol--serine O-phosphatidyltransferase [Nitrospirota bacterium]
MRKGIYILPNLLTIGGMFFGFYSIVASIKGDFERAAFAILTATVFDALDGWVARLTKSTSRFGLELDSLSDLVSFGVAPAVMFYIWALVPFKRWGWVGAFLFVVCGALRLARFNVQMVGSEKKWFTGLPIPGGAAVLATFVIFYLDNIGDAPDSNILILVMIYIVALLMISTIKFHSIKELNVRDRRPFWMLLVAVIILVAIALNPPVVLFVISISYVGWALIEYVLTFKKRKAKIRAA